MGLGFRVEGLRFIGLRVRDWEGGGGGVEGSGSTPNAQP